MNYGLYLSASGVQTALYRQDVAANNLANINTPGFKADLTALRQRDVARVEDGLPSLPSNALLERLGGGVMVLPNAISFMQGPLQTTNNDLDLAIQGDGFFVVRDETDRNTDRLHFTRDGRFTRDAGGRLVSVTEGLPVMDVNNRPIVLPEGPVRIGPDGIIRQGELEFARIQVADVPDRSRLVKLGHARFQVPADQLESRLPAAGSVKQGQVEGASVDPIAALMGVTGATGDVERNLAMIQYQDRMMDRAINTLGRVS